MNHKYNFEKAELLLAQGRYSEALSKIDEVLQFVPEDTNALMLKSFIVANMGERFKAIKILKSALQIDSMNPYLYYNLANFTLPESYSTSIAYIRTALEIMPDNPNFHSLAALIEIKNNNLESAYRHLKVALELDPRNKLSLSINSTLAFSLFNKKEAIELLNKLIQNYPEDPSLHNRLAWWYLEVGKSEDALNHFNTSLSIDPHNKNAQNGLAEALKSNFLIYRVYLVYSLFINRIGEKTRWILVLLALILARFFSSFNSTSPEYKKITIPLTILFIGFILSTWMIEPIGNIYLRYHKYGKNLLNQKLKTLSTVNSFLLFLSVVSGISFYFIDIFTFLQLAVISFTMIIPVSHYYDDIKEENTFRIFPWLLSVIGFAQIVLFIVYPNLHLGWNLPYIVFYFIFIWSTSRIMLER